MKASILRHVLCASVFGSLASIAFASAPAADRFAEEFDGEKSDWAFVGDDGTQHSTLEGGVLRWHNRGPAGGGFGRSVKPVDFAGDFELAVRLRLAAHEGSGMVGVQWLRSNDGKSFYQMAVNERGQFDARVQVPDDWRRLFPARTLPELSGSDFNEFRVRRVGGSFYFYVNDRIVGHALGAGVAGPTFANRIDPGMTGEFDYVRVRSLPADEARATVAEFDAWLRADPDAAQPLVETFDDNRREWPGIGDLEYSIGEITDGELHYENLRLEANLVDNVTTPAPLLAGRDYAIELDIRWTGGRDNQGFGLVWNRFAGRGELAFCISGNKQYSIRRYIGGKWEFLVPWTAGREIVHGPEQGNNRLTVRKLGEQTYYFINDHLVGRQPAPKQLEAYTGFSVPAGVSVAVDGLRVTYALEDPATLARRAADYDERWHALRLAAGPPLERWFDTFDDNRSAWLWTGPMDEINYSIADGRLVAENPVAKGKVELAEKRINGLADYDLRLKFTQLSGADNAGIGLIWGRSNNGDEALSFIIAPNGSYRFTKTTGNKLEEVLPWTKSAQYRQGANEVMVRKVGDRFFFYLNGQVMADAPASAPVGHFLGMEIGQSMTVAYEEIELTYHRRTPAESAAALAAVDAELAAAHRAKKITGVVHAATAATEAAERAKENAVAQRLDDADYKQLDKVRKQFVGKPLLSLYAQWKQPASIAGDTQGSHSAYYRYRDKAGRQYYYEFQIIYNKPTHDMNGKPLPRQRDGFVVNHVTLTDFVRR